MTATCVKTKQWICLANRLVCQNDSHEFICHDDSVRQQILDGGSGTIRFLLRALLIPSFPFPSYFTKAHTAGCIVGITFGVCLLVWIFA